jgi:Lon protease-like protein
MGWFGSRPTAPPRTDLALFPLRGPLLPGGWLTLKVFEVRYLDLMSECLRERAPFGICMIAQGEEVNAPGAPPATPHAIGTVAHVSGADMREPGIMQVAVRGAGRFRIVERRVEAGGLQRASVELLSDAPCAIPPQFAGLVPLLRQVLADLGEVRMPPPHPLDDALWVGHRLVEVLPVQALAKQKLLELDDPLARLEIVQTWLRQRGVAV